MISKFNKYLLMCLLYPRPGVANSKYIQEPGRKVLV